MFYTDLLDLGGCCFGLFPLIFEGLLRLTEFGFLPLQVLLEGVLLGRCFLGLLADPLEFLALLTNCLGVLFLGFPFFV